MTLIGDGIADDTDAIECMIDEANGERVALPAGTFRITRDLNWHPSGSYSPGLWLEGAHPLRTTILADYDGDVDLGAIIRLDTQVISNYTLNSKIKNLKIKQASGRKGLNGIQLTAAWFVEIKDVHIQGLTGNGVVATLRPDIHPTISDYYQSFAVELLRLYISSCAGWAVKFAAGQSPGLYSLKHSMIWGNSGGGVMSTTGQCEIIGNSIAENGIGGDGGGVLFDTAEGPNMVALVAQNELDCNFNYNLWLKRTRIIRVTENRFLSATVESPKSWTRVSGSPYMRPAVHAKLGAQGAEVVRALFEQNLHRSVTGPQPTTAEVIAYQNAGDQLSQCRLWYNDIDYCDGMNQNSSCMTKYAGFENTDTSIIDKDAPPPQPIPPPSGPLIVKARATVAQDIYGTLTNINYNAEDADAGALFNGYYFAPKQSGTYQIIRNHRIKALASGETVQMIVWKPQANVAAASRNITASGSETQDFSATETLTLQANEILSFALIVPWPSKPMNVADASKNYIEIRGPIEP